jgi:hypothetical protein
MKPAYWLYSFHTGWARDPGLDKLTPVQAALFMVWWQPTNPTRETSLSKPTLQFPYGLARLLFGPACPGLFGYSQYTWIGWDWKKLWRSLSCLGFKPIQSRSIHMDWELTEQALTEPNCEDHQQQLWPTGSTSNGAAGTTCHGSAYNRGHLQHTILAGNCTKSMPLRTPTGSIFTSTRLSQTGTSVLNCGLCFFHRGSGSCSSRGSRADRPEFLLHEQFNHKLT